MGPTPTAAGPKQEPQGWSGPDQASHLEMRKGDVTPLRFHHLGANKPKILGGNEKNLGWRLCGWTGRKPKLLPLSAELPRLRPVDGQRTLTPCPGSRAQLMRLEGFTWKRIGSPCGCSRMAPVFMKFDIKSPHNGEHTGKRKK